MNMELKAKKKKKRKVRIRKAKMAEGRWEGEKEAALGMNKRIKDLLYLGKRDKINRMSLPHHSGICTKRANNTD